MKKLLYILCLLMLLLSFQSVGAQAGKSYYYKSYDVDITVQKDSSFNVEERQLYSYTGNFNKGYRNIPFKDISSISNIEVVDGQTGSPLTYSSKILEKTDPNSWGKYTYHKSNGEMIIEWYYDLKDTDHLWILKYKVYGGIGYYKDYDEVYWNIFTNYDVPINSSTVYINLPANSFSASDLRSAIYTSDANNNPQMWYKDSDQKIDYFTAGPFSPKQSFTVSLGWPKGLLNQSDFWKYWLLTNWAYLSSTLIILWTIIYLFIFWLRRELLKKGRGTIIAEYEPPHNLPPAMAELIVTERNTPRAWSATIVDLAVRGYVKIEEEPITFLKKIIRIIIPISIFVFSFAIVFITEEVFPAPFIVGATILILLFISFKKSADYKVTKLKDFGADEKLHDYEKRFLRIMFSGKESFSTYDMKTASNADKRGLYLEMKELKEKLLEEVSLDESSTYDIPISNQSSFNFIYALPIILGFVVFGIIIFSGGVASYLILIAVIVWSYFTILIFKRYNPRLSREGLILKEEWLGFKMYLEVTEKYRMQKLTPELFEKYLPYAMIFKIEKQWAKNFDSIITTPPAWYGSSGQITNAGGFGLVNGVGTFGASSSRISNFSASAFSSSFSSSLASAFASSGASGGGSGGGGGAGGGGGGGGGGAS